LSKKRITNKSRKLSRLGEVNYNRLGKEMTITTYNSSRDIAVKFESGNIVEHKAYSSFKNGDIGDKASRLLETSYNAYNNKMTIVKYITCFNILVQFESGYTVKNKYEDFLTGSISSPYDKSICGVGYIGEGKFDAYNKGVPTLAYSSWQRVISRSYNEKFKIRCTTYKDCTCSKEWLNFQCFALWFSENYYEVEGYKMNVDKDILIKHNKLYSAETCIIVPHNINGLFVKSDAIRGKTCIGTTYNIEKNKFLASCKDNKGSTKYLGQHDTEMKGFLAYKTYKEKLIKQIADEFKDKIPIKLYDALYRYEVEFTD